MKKVEIVNWKQYGDYMLFAGIVSEFRLGIILQTTPDRIVAMGEENRIDKFCDQLDKKQIVWQKTEKLF